MSYYTEAKERAEELFKRELSDRELAEVLSERNCILEEEVSTYDEEITAVKKELRRLSESITEHELPEEVLSELDEILSISADECEITVRKNFLGVTVTYTINGSKAFYDEDDDE